MSEATHVVGHPLPRVDAVEKVQGKAQNSVDLVLPHMLHGAFLRSPLAWARIVNVDTSQARRVPGVRAVVTGADFPYSFGSTIKDRPFLEGAVVMGTSGATTEEVLLNAKGVTLNPNLHDYKISTALDAPEMRVGIVEAHQADGPFGAKGVGEPALAATAPAIGNAVFDACGVRITDLPITAEKILAGLQAKGRA